ncbi:hypothetical protein PMM47T1_28251 [Pseudomonas sp. M47T1]|nr:hypothetical protein PMM47T1_28251 [Pseudomonas sp. M47T1]
MKAVLEQQGVPNPEMGLSVSFLDCSTGVSKFVERLPYIADAGQIQDAFLARTSKDEQEVFLIHSVPFRASGGVSLGSDYFTVLVYRRTDDGFVQDKKLTEYFGSGADIISIRDDDEKTLYSYPFKTQEDIKRQLSSDNYHSWFTGMPIERVVNSKASIYSMQSTSGDTGMYLVKGDRVKQERYSAGWVYILYVTAKKKEIRGWVLCERINGC